MYLMFVFLYILSKWFIKVFTIDPIKNFLKVFVSGLNRWVLDFSCRVENLYISNI